MKNENLIIENLKILSRDVRDIRETIPNIARIEEHLKNLNGTVQRHEKEIDNLDIRCDGEDKRIDKISWILSGIASMAGAIGGFIVMIISKIFK